MAKRTIVTQKKDGYVRDIDGIEVYAVKDSKLIFKFGRLRQVRMPDGSRTYFKDRRKWGTWTPLSECRPLTDIPYIERIENYLVEIARKIQNLSLF